MNTIHCDINHIENGMKMLNNTNNDNRYLVVWDSDCVMRGIPMEEVRERNILADDPNEVCRIEHSSYNSFRFYFHQSEVNKFNTFEFQPHNSGNCTTPDELGENLKQVVDELESIWGNLFWDFAGVDSQSYARDGKLTDFEFEYSLMF